MLHGQPHAPVWTGRLPARRQRATLAAPDLVPPMSVDNNQRDLEAGIHTDLQGRLTYGGYLRLDQLPDQVAGASTEEPTAANPLARAMNDNTILRYRAHYLPWLRTYLQASLGLGLDALPFSDAAKAADGRPGLADIGDELAAIKAYVLQLGS